MVGNYDDQRLSDYETELVERSFVWRCERARPERIAGLLGEQAGSLLSLLAHDPRSYNDLPTDHKIAAEIQFLRDRADDPDFGLPEARVMFTVKAVRSGFDLIDEYGEYWRFEPCIEKVFELEDSELTTLYEYLQAFRETDYYDALQQYREPFLGYLRAWDPTDPAPR